MSTTHGLTCKCRGVRCPADVESRSHRMESSFMSASYQLVRPHALHRVMERRLFDESQLVIKRFLCADGYQSQDRSPPL